MLTDDVLEETLLLNSTFIILPPYPFLSLPLSIDCIQAEITGAALAMVEEFTVVASFMLMSPNLLSKVKTTKLCSVLTVFASLTVPLSRQ